ncbi:MAG TPA: lysozyme inhibitor LprI family protein [Xanthobacteraceae bacterium]
MTARILLALAISLSGVPLAGAYAQTRKPTAQEVAAIRNCAAKYQDDVDEGERHCVFNLVATPCTNTREGSSNVGTADCYRVEWVIWDNLLNENFKNLMDALDNQQTAKLRAMQQAWITYRDTTFFGFSIKSRVQTAQGRTVQPSRRSYSSTALSNTCAPAAHCSKLVHSASFRLGTKTMVVGATRAT